jgi:hypothetical protein
MTDSTNSANDALEGLVTAYETGITNLDTGDTTTLLNNRSEIENRWSDLSTAQAQRVEDADAYLVQNSGQVASRLAAAGTSLRELRSATPRPSEHWWWYLDVVSHVSDELAATTPSSSSVFSKIITIVELVVLAVAIFLLARNFIPQLQGNASTSNTSPSGSSATAFPSWTPAPTATTDPAAFDMAQATVYKSPDNVVQIKLPKGWTTTPSQTPGRIAYNFGYGGDQTSPAILLQVLVDDPTVLYTSFLGLSTAPASPQAALEALKANSAGGQFTFGDVKAAKVGTLDASSLAISIPASAQGGPATEFELRIAPLEGGKIVFIGMQSSQDLWKQAQPVLGQMVDSLVVTPGNIPTATPTLTPHPLELTATAIQNLAATNMAEILALTPSPTPAPTEAATGAGNRWSIE